MNNEPVAWMETYKGEPNNLDWDKSNLNYGSEFHDVIPLYTHPAKELDEQFKKGFEAGKEEGWKAHKFHHPAEEQDTECQYCKQGCIRCDARKQLTDEEITACIDESEPDTTDMIRFARAILRKASEK